MVDCSVSHKRPACFSSLSRLAFCLTFGTWSVIEGNPLDAAEDLKGPYGACGSEAPSSPSLQWCLGRQPSMFNGRGNMSYRALGRTGLRVSELSYGVMNFVRSGAESRESAEARAVALLRAAVSGGVNLFDNAEGYGAGEAEEIFGQALGTLFEERAVRRPDLVVATKLFGGGAGVNDRGLSRKHLVEGMQRSLARLRLTYVDVVLCHRPDSTTPIEEIVRAMNHIVEKGWALYWGTSEWPAVDIASAIAVARELRLVGPVVEQTKFNLFYRERVEVELWPLIQREGLGIMAHSALAEGILAGRYLDYDPEDHEAPLPSGSRFEGVLRATGGKVNLVRKFRSQVEAARRLAPLAAAELGASPAELALAWALGKRELSTVLIGASSPEQLLQNLQALRLKPLSDDLVRRVEAEAEDAGVPLAAFTRHIAREAGNALAGRGPHA